MSAHPKSFDVVSEIFAERVRQIEVEGRTPGHDDGYQLGELAIAAACYADPEPISVSNRPGHYLPVRWPWEASWWKPKTRRQDLIRAAALIVAEIERLDRAERR